MPFRCKLTLRPELAWCALALTLSATASVDVSQHELPFAQVGTLLDGTSGVASQEIAHLATNVADIASSPRPEFLLEPARLALATAAPTRERNPHQDLIPLLANPPPELIERYPETRVWGFGLPDAESTGSDSSLTDRTHWGCEPSWLGLASGYVFEVDADHSFFVGENALLVHNACPRINLSPSKAPKSYSVAFEMDLDPSFWGKSEKVHFRRANEVLDIALQSDPAFAAKMEKLIPGVRKAVSETGGRETPANWVWEHASSSTTPRTKDMPSGRMGVMRLVPDRQHTPGSPWWRVFHRDPGAAGGYAEWARPAGAPKRK